MKTIKILTESNGIVTIDVTNVTDADSLANELIAKYGKFIQL